MLFLVPVLVTAVHSGPPLSIDNALGMAGTAPLPKAGDALIMAPCNKDPNYAPQWWHHNAPGSWLVSPLASHLPLFHNTA